MNNMPQEEPPRFNEKGEKIERRSEANPDPDKKIIDLRNSYRDQDLEEIAVKNNGNLRPWFLERGFDINIEIDMSGKEKLEKDELGRYVRKIIEIVNKIGPENFVGKGRILFTLNSVHSGYRPLEDKEFHALELGLDAPKQELIRLIRERIFEVAL